MNARKRELARHALGLPNSTARSYRNRYLAAYVPGGPYDLWDELVAAGLAEAGPFEKSGKSRWFSLTRAGAEAALDPGETLCPEDFTDA